MRYVKETFQYQHAHAELGSIVSSLHVVWPLQGSDLGATTDGAQIGTFGGHEVEPWEAVEWSFLNEFHVLLHHVAIVIPEVQRRLVPRMLIAQDAQRRRGQDKMACGPGEQAQPAGGQDAQKMAVAEDQHVTLHRPQARYHPVGTGAHHLDRLATRTAVAEEIPPRTLLANVGGALPFVLAVIPLLPVGVDLGLATEARRRTRLQRPRQRARQEPGEHGPFEPLCQAPGLALAACSEWDVCPAGVLTGERPGGLAVPRQVHLGR
jgi:hypothetical protein